MALPRILHIIPSLAPGGAEQILMSLTRSLAGEFHHTILVLRPAEKELIPDKSVEVKHLGIYREIDFMRRFGSLRRTIKTSRANLIHGWMYHANLLSIISLDLKIPLVWSIHNALQTTGSIKRSTNVINQVSAKLSSIVPDLVIYCSSQALQKHEQMGYCPHKSRVIPNGVDGKQFYPDAGKRVKLRQDLCIGEEIPLFGRIARFDPQKDYETFFAAAARVIHELPKARFLLCGDKTEATNSEFLALAQKNGLGPRCHFLGLRRNMIGIYNGIDVLVSSSISEASPVSLLEAMACGTPVATTDVGDCARMIGNTGMTAQPGNSTQLAAAMVATYKQRQKTPVEMVQRCRRRSVDHFGIKKMARQYGLNYRELLKLA